MFLLAAALWYLNKYTSIRDYLVEDIVRKIHAKTCESLLQEDPKEDPEDVPAPLS